MKMKENFERMFGSSPKPASSPLKQGDHPELDDSEELLEDDIKKYQSQLQ